MRLEIFWNIQNLQQLQVAGWGFTPISHSFQKRNTFWFYFSNYNMIVWTRGNIYYFPWRYVEKRVEVVLLNLWNHSFVWLFHRWILFYKNWAELIILHFPRKSNNYMILMSLVIDTHTHTHIDIYIYMW